MYSVLFLLIAVAEAVLLVVFLRAVLRHRRPADLIPVILTAVLVFENVVIGLGSRIGEGALLEQLNAPRFIGHALVTPLLVVWGFVLLRRQKVGWTLTRTAVVSVALITVALVAYGVNHDVVHLELVPAPWEDTLRYGNANTPPGPPLTAILTGMALIVAGGQLWIETRSTVLAWAAGFMAVVAGLASWWPVLANFGELVLLLGILHALGVRPEQKRAPRAVVSKRAQQIGWVVWPFFIAAACLSFIPVWGGEVPDGLPVSQSQYDFVNASQGVWIVLMTLHAHYAISVFGLARNGSRLRRFHVWFGYANLFLTFGGQLLFIFPQTATLGSRATELVFITITVHVALGTWFALKRGRSRRRPVATRTGAEREAVPA